MSVIAVYGALFLFVLFILGLLFLISKNFMMGLRPFLWPAALFCCMGIFILLLLGRPILPMILALLVIIVLLLIFR